MSRADAEGGGVLMIALVTLGLCTLAVYGAAKTTQVVMGRFGLDLMAALLWLGLAEHSGEARVRQRVIERPAGPRRRSPH